MLEAALKRRLKWLREYAAAYDEGDHDEAYRMSVELRALLHHGTDMPLLYELDVIKKIEYASSVPIRPEPTGRAVSIWGGGLTVMTVRVGDDGQSTGGVVPRWEVEKDQTDVRFVSYTEWWSREKAVTAEDGRRYSRGFLVQQMGNQDGAHTDAALTEEYESLGRRPTVWSVPTEAGDLPIESDIAKASIRQITWELLLSLHRARLGVDDS